MKSTTIVVRSSSTFGYVTADERVTVRWRYLLISEADVEAARGKWPAMKALAGS